MKCPRIISWRHSPAFPADATGVRSGRYYEETRLPRERRPVVVASFGSTSKDGPMQTSLGKVH